MNALYAAKWNSLGYNNLPKGAYMDLKGFEAINAALAAADIDATVVPRPAEGQDVRFVTVETDESIQPSRVLNALAEKAMIACDGPQDAVYCDGPELRSIGVQAGSITFDDGHAGSGRVWG